jgi:hypothetical protein
MGPSLFWQRDQLVEGAIMLLPFLFVLQEWTKSDTKSFKISQASERLAKPAFQPLSAWIPIL